MSNGRSTVIDDLRNYLLGSRPQSQLYRLHFESSEGELQVVGVALLGFLLSSGSEHEFIFVVVLEKIGDNRLLDANCSGN